MVYNPSSQKNKLQNAELTNGVQANAISLQQWMESKIVSRVNTTQPKDTTLAKTTQWDTEWETVESISQVGIVTQVWKGWSIPIGQINHLWLARFSVELLFRNGNLPFQVSNSTLFKKSIGWDLKDVAGKETSDVKDTTLVAYVHSQFINHPIFEVKLIVRYIDQSLRG